MANIDIQHLNKKFGDLEIIPDFSLRVKDKEFISLLGPSGCGKSTILRIVAGLEMLSKGQIIIDDRDVTALEPKDRDVAMVFQNYALYPHKTVFENLAYGQRIRKKPKAEIIKGVTEVAELLQIGELLDRRPAQLSGGQQQRVAMGRAIMREPAAFLFDEPLSNLDAKLRNHMRVEIRQLQQRLGITTLYVTHDQVEAMTMSDRIVVLNKGRVEQVGKPLEIYEKPASLFVAGFIGTPAMNLFDVEVKDNNLHIAGNAFLPLSQIRPDGLLTLGLRPERLKIRGEQTDLSVPFKILLVEELGSGKVVHGKISDVDVVVAMPEDQEIPSENAYVEFSESFMHFFDSETGRRI